MTEHDAQRQLLKHFQEVRLITEFDVKLGVDRFACKTNRQAITAAIKQLTEALEIIDNHEEYLPPDAPNSTGDGGQTPETAPVKLEQPRPGLDPLLEMVRKEDYLVLDTETTGLRDGEICQIAIIDQDGNVLLDELVKTVDPIPGESTNIHGITDDMVKDARPWSLVVEDVRKLLAGKNVVVYNAVYDRKMMHQSNDRSGLDRIDWKRFTRWYCAMEAYAEFYGEWNDYHGNYRWQRLTMAAKRFNIPTDGAHSALADCQMTLAVVKAMAEATKETN